MKATKTNSWALISLSLTKFFAYFVFCSVSRIFFNETTKITTKYKLIEMNIESIKTSPLNLSLLLFKSNNIAAIMETMIDITQAMYQIVFNLLIVAFLSFSCVERSVLFSCCYGTLYWIARIIGSNRAALRY